MKKLFSNLSTEVKIGIAVVVAILLYVYGKKIWKAFTAPPTSDETVNVNPVNLTFPVGDYSIAAEHIQQAMFDLGTDEAAIYSVIDTMQTADDLRQLIKSFGQRDYYSFGISAWKGGLIEWLVYEMSEAELEPIKNKFNSLGVAF